MYYMVEVTMLWQCMLLIYRALWLFRIVQLAHTGYQECPHQAQDTDLTEAK